MAPMKSEGEKNPPAKPEPSDIAVAAVFRPSEKRYDRLLAPDLAAELREILAGKLTVFATDFEIALDFEQIAIQILLERTLLRNAMWWARGADE